MVIFQPRLPVVKQWENEVITYVRDECGWWHQTHFLIPHLVLEVVGAVVIVLTNIKGRVPAF